MIKFKSGILVLASILLIFVGCGSKSKISKESNEKIVLKLGHTASPNHPYQKGSLMFADIVSKKTNGMVEIKVFPADQLGKQKELVEGAQLGTVDMVLTSDVLLSTFEPKFGLLNLPFLFSDYDNVQKALNGDVGKKLGLALEKKNLKVLGWFENGFRDITNSKIEINNPEDLKGLKIRTPSGVVFIRTFDSLGANATPMSFGELYSALQLKTVDGQENPTTHILTQKFYEVQKYLSLTHHIHVSEPLIMSKTIYDKLTPEYQQILLDAAREVSKWSFETTKDTEAIELKEIKEKGMIISKPDIKAFKKATEVVYDTYKDQEDAMEIINEIRANSK